MIPVSRSAARGAGVTGAVAAGFGAPDLAQDDGGGASDTRIHLDRARLAVESAGAALYTRVPVHYPGSGVLDLKHRVRTNHHAHATARTLLRIELEGCNALKISQSRHRQHLPVIGRAFRSARYKNLDAIHSPIPTIAEAIWSGSASFISFLTPESEVNVVDPVKFMTMNDVMQA
jgi:hypothetical protein